MRPKAVKKLVRGDWRGTLLLPSASIQDAVRVLNDVCLKIVLVADRSGKLLGTVSDGDIRRGLSRGYGLDSCVSKILHRNPVAVLGETQRDNVRDKMVTHQIQQIPILDNFRRVVGLHLWDEISQSPDRPNIFVVMAGGEGKRLYPFTLARPKPMLEVGGKPVLEHIIVKAKKEGFRQFVIAVRHLGGMIEKFFGCGKNWGINISYLKEQMPLGTAGALRLLKPLPRDPLVVINGDVLADFSYGDLLDFHARHKGDATMAVRLHDWQNPYGVVETQGLKITGLQEKPLVRTQINAGVYVLNPSACRQIPRLIRFDMTDLFRKLRNRKKRTLAYPLHGRWVDIGKPDDLRKAKNSIRK